MRINFTFLLVAILFSMNLIAGSKFWTGANSQLWSDGANWSPVGSPGINDTAFFTTSGTVDVDVNPLIYGLQIKNSANVILNGTGTRLITIANGGFTGLVFFIEQESTLTIQGASSGRSVSIQTYGNFVTTTAKINGTFILGAYNSTWTLGSFPASFTNTDVSGVIRIAANNTGSCLSTATNTTLRFLSGSKLEWQRSGGSGPNANFQDGSIINVTGIAGSNMGFNSSAIYNGLLIWNCPSQTISGSSAILLPTLNATMDSIRVVNTGSGSLRFATNPNGYTIGSLEVQGGIVELSAPNSGTNSLTDTIVNEFKISGGTVYGNATYNFDNLSGYPDTLILKGNFIQTGGNFDFTNRPSGLLPGGSFVLTVKGNVEQSAGLITASQGFGAQNQLNMSGTTMQNLTLKNISGIITLGINNALGVDLKNNLTLPYFLLLQKGFLQINQYNVTVAASQIIQSGVNPKPRVVTNGFGKLVITNIGNGGLQTFPVAPFINGYNQVTIANGEATAKTFNVRVEYGINPLSIGIDLNKVVNRTWTINATTPTTPNNIGLKFSYADTEKVVSATLNPAASMELAHFTSTWNIDPPGNLVPTGGPVNYAVGSFTPSSVDSSFVIGNVGFIAPAITQYIFIGTGDWDVENNWLNNIKPPNPLLSGSEIIIDPIAGDCILNIPQTIAPGGKITVMAGKNLLLPTYLILQ